MKYMRSKVKHHCKKSALESYMLVQFLTVCLYTGQIRAKYVQCGTCLASYAYFSVFFFKQKKPNKQTIPFVVINILYVVL